MKALGRKLAGLYHRVLRYGLAYAEQGLRVCEWRMRRDILAPQTNRFEPVLDPAPGSNRAYRLIPPLRP